MNKLELKIGPPGTEFPDAIVVQIWIDGNPLIDLLKVYELPFAQKEGNPQIAGAYMGFHPEDFLQHLEEVNEAGKTVLLDCTCGVWGCWTLFARISPSENRVIWSDFEQKHRRAGSAQFWDYKDFGPFEFDRKDYEAQLEALKNRESEA